MDGRTRCLIRGLDGWRDKMFNQGSSISCTIVNIFGDVHKDQT